MIVLAQMWCLWARSGPQAGSLTPHVARVTTDCFVFMYFGLLL